jgi:hypothetical protein
VDPSTWSIAASCIVCGSSFRYDRQAGIAGRPRAFCSTKCKAARAQVYNRKLYQKTDGKRPPTSKCMCVNCGEAFLATTPKGKCCSKACISAHLTKVGTGRQSPKKVFASRRDQDRHFVTLRRQRLSALPAVPYSETEIFERDGWFCQICGEEVDRNLRYPNRMSASIDHRHPLSKGGCDTPDNVQLAHLSCNCRKGAAV